MSQGLVTRAVGSLSTSTGIEYRFFFSLLPGAGQGGRVGQQGTIAFLRQRGEGVSTLGLVCLFVRSASRYGYGTVLRAARVRFCEVSKRDLMQQLTLHSALPPQSCLGCYGDASLSRPFGLIRASCGITRIFWPKEILTRNHWRI